MAGMHGTYAANMALYESDLLISIGARFDDRVTGNLKHFAKYAKVAHIDIDPAEIGKNVHTHIPVVGDSKLVLTELIKQNGRDVTEKSLKLLGIQGFEAFGVAKQQHPKNSLSSFQTK